MNRQSFITAITLAVSASAVDAIVNNIIGKEVADTINGNQLTPSVLSELTACTLDAQFNQHKLA